MARQGEEHREALIEQASALLVRLDSGTASIQDLEKWRDADPRHAAALIEVTGVWRRLDDLKLAEAEPSAPRISRRAWMGGGGAALAAGLAGTVYLGRDILFRERLRTGIGERRSLVLSDGSLVELNTDSEAYWQFDRMSRRFWLEHGEAAITVAKDHARPFTLMAGIGLAKLTAGQFNARLRPSGLNLMVVNGAAAVESPVRQAQASVNAAGNQHQMVQVSDNSIEVVAAREGEVQNLQAWRHGEIVFEGQTLVDAVGEYNRYLTRKLVVDDDHLAGIRLGGRFLTSDPDGFLQALNTSFGIRTINDGPSRILLKS